VISVIIPAHNESLVIERTLSMITAGSGYDELDVAVVCNGCTDNTAEIARRFSPAVRVIESTLASKTSALNLGDQSARSFPRIYIDADIVITIEAIRALVSFLARGEFLAAAPTADINLAGCSWPVRKYFEIREYLPSSREGFGGSGVYALSEAGRRRFGEFPNITADDLYVRLQFRINERKTIESIRSTVFAPRTIRQLVAIRTRAHYGTFEVESLYPEKWVNKGESNRGALLALLARPHMWLGLLIYSLVNAAARWNAKNRRRRAESFVWAQDNTSRRSL
jgi:glycosyltransferase involved in cell wall biosynthesis